MSSEPVRCLRYARSDEGVSPHVLLYNVVLLFERCFAFQRLSCRCPCPVEFAQCLDVSDLDRVLEGECLLPQGVPLGAQVQVLRPLGLLPVVQDPALERSRVCCSTTPCIKRCAVEQVAGSFSLPCLLRLLCSQPFSSLLSIYPKTLKTS